MWSDRRKAGSAFPSHSMPRKRVEKIPNSIIDAGVQERIGKWGLGRRMW
jgi:hypothetical protein